MRTAKKVIKMKNVKNEKNEKQRIEEEKVAEEMFKQVQLHAF